MSKKDIEAIIASPKMQNRYSSEEWGKKSRKRQTKSKGRLRNKIRAFLKIMRDRAEVSSTVS